MSPGRAATRAQRELPCRAASRTAAGSERPRAKPRDAGVRRSGARGSRRRAERRAQPRSHPPRPAPTRRRPGRAPTPWGPRSRCCRTGRTRGRRGTTRGPSTPWRSGRTREAARPTGRRRRPGRDRRGAGSRCRRPVGPRPRRWLGGSSSRAPPSTPSTTGCRSSSPARTNGASDRGAPSTPRRGRSREAGRRASARSSPSGTDPTSTHRAGACGRSGPPWRAGTAPGSTRPSCRPRSCPPRT